MLATTNPEPEEPMSNDLTGGLVVTVTKSEPVYLCRTSKAFKKLSVGVFPFSWKYTRKNLFAE